MSRDPDTTAFRYFTGAKQVVFNTIVLHAKPRDAVAEVSALADVYDYATNITSVRVKNV